jgi:hypothetical protein
MNMKVVTVVDKTYEVRLVNLYCYVYGGTRDGF